MKLKNKTIHKILFTLALFTSMVQNSQARETSLETGDEYVPSGPSLTLPSPISQTYQRFMGFQPNLATGAVNVTIPLHTINIDDFSLPITLNYQSNGIKREDISFPLGYGWVLHPGLRITRTVMGKPDEQAPLKNYFNGTGSDPDYFKYLELSGREEDSMYDVYTLSLPQGQANFLVEGTSIWSSQWNAITTDIPYKITPLKQVNESYFSGFKIIDEKGITYFFGDENKVDNSKFIELSSAAGRVVPTTYLLRKVILPGNQEITLEWEINSATDVRFTSCYFDSDNGASKNHGEDTPAGGPSISREGAYQYINDGSKIRGSNLSKITLPNSTVNFFYTGEGIESISIYNSQQNLIKDIKFKVKNHLLQNLIINGDEQYKFHYNSQNFDRSSIYDQDFWGYYNAANNEVDYPTVTYMTTEAYWNQYKPKTISGANRKPNANAMQAYILEQIDYPTGGYTRYEYEPHRYMWNKEEHFGGGLRVKRMISGTNGKNEDKQIVKTYKYGSSENGCGYCSIEPNEQTFISEEFLEYESSPYYASCRQLTIHPQSLFSSYFMFNLPVYYGEVTEYTSNNGKSLYSYKYEPDCISSDYITDISNYLNNEYTSYRREMIMNAPIEYLHIFDKVPRLSRKILYDLKGKEKMREEYSYEERIKPQKTLNCINFRKVYSNLGDSHLFRPDKVYDYVRAFISIKQYFLKTKTNIENEVKSSISYQYNNLGIRKSITICHSDSTIEYEDFLYANDNLSQLAPELESYRWTLLDNLRPDLPLRIRKSVNGNVVAQKVIKYQAGKASNISTNFVCPQTEYFQNGNHPEETRVEYNKCNLHGKPTEITVDGKTSVYLWGYCNQYPIAKIENATYTEVTSVLGELLPEEIAAAIAPNEQQWETVNALRTQLPNAKVSTYTYKPMIGLLSETNPAGLSVYYTYNTSGKLTEKYRLNTDAAGIQTKEMIETYTYTYKK